MKELLEQLARYEKDLKISNRYFVCSSCEFLENDNGSPKCGNCGCNLMLKINDEENCSLGKW